MRTKHWIFTGLSARQARQGAALIGLCLLVGTGLNAQEELAPPRGLDPMAAVPYAVPVRNILSSLSNFRVQPGTPEIDSFTWRGNSFTPAGRSATLVSGPRYLTLEMAQEQAASGTEPLARLGELQVEAARRNRLAVKGNYFPQISALLLNNHFTKFPGNIYTLNRPGVGSATIPLNIVSKDSTVFSSFAVQPITPLFAVRQLIKIAEADEVVARAKAAKAAGASKGQVEKTYFSLLIAQSELTISQARVEELKSKYLVASSSHAIPVPAPREAEMIEAEKAVVMAKSNVRELMASMNAMLGWPEDTRLELSVPEPLSDGLTLEDVQNVQQKTAAANMEIVEAEQTAVKARAGEKLAKMEHFPVVAVMGGYSRQNLANVILQRDVAFFGFVATFNVFDGGKRENTIKQRSAQRQAAELAVQLTKAKVAEDTKKAYFELSRARELSQLARRMYTASPFVSASYEAATPDIKESRAVLEVEVLKTELAHREAYARLLELLGNR